VTWEVHLPSLVPLPRCLKDLQCVANLGSQFGAGPQVERALSAPLPVGQGKIWTQFSPRVTAPRDNYSSLATENLRLSSKERPDGVPFLVNKIAIFQNAVLHLGKPLGRCEPAVSLS
jgi:hypothetical protein